MKEGIIAISLYLLEVIKYIIGYRLIFSGKIKSLGLIKMPCSLYLILIILNIFPLNSLCFFSYIAAAISTYFILEGEWRERLFRIISILAISSCLDEIIGIILTSSLFKERAQDILLVESAITISIFLFFIFLLSKIKRKETMVNNSLPMKKGVVIVSLILTLCFMSGGLLYLQNYLPEKRLRMMAGLLGGLAYFCIVIIMIYILSIKSHSEKIERLVETERRLKQMGENYYEALLKKEEETKRYRHDMQNHILCLKEYAKEENALFTLQYIESLQERVEEIQKKVFFTGNDILDIFLNYYLQPLENIEIMVTGMCKTKLKIDQVDFCIIVSNILQNAVEEILRLKDNHRYIIIKVVQGKSYFKLEVRNSSDKEFDLKKKMILTQKKDKENHGIGINNIRETIEKNSGEFDLKGNGKECRATVILPIS